MIELRHLRYAVAVADAGHMTRAAEALGIQQPPLSQQIRALEDAVGSPLFRRLPRGMQLTDAGRVLTEKARQILRDVDLAIEAARRTARGEQGSLAIGFTSSATFHPLVSAAVRALHEASPGITLKLEEGSTANLIDDLRADRLDAAFVRSPVERADGLVIAPILEEEMLIALPDRHPLAAAPAPLPLAALAQEVFILYRRPTGPGLYDSIIAACRNAGFSPRIGQEAPQLMSTLSLVAAGLGISLIPASMARLETNGIAYRHLLPSVGLTAPLQLAYRAQAPSGALQRFIDTVRQQQGCRLYKPEPL